MRTVLEGCTLARLRATRLSFAPGKETVDTGKSKVVGRGSIKLQREKKSENKKGNNKYIPIIQKFTCMLNFKQFFLKA